ncbi:mammalian cell entry protein [Mycobacterium paragordonae]|uniref:Mammalian cell entry protein n=1 Tax=Mycobacterium paragordonae TaxID=1389713 RepID=A0AAJ1W094_9MYCO|nr:mammalian cell entry protein [Mycobacterium paragordonae]MDP7734720.1 mammalian cell entry protein [Mycobacterium paragordonae]
MAIDAAAAGQLTAESVVAEEETPLPVRARRSLSAHGWATVFGLVAVVALATLTWWLGLRAQQSQQAQAQRSQFLQVARQGALNLTTIDWQHADVDVRRILDSATGEFYHDFAGRSGPFIEVLKQAKASTVGTITEAGLESQGADSAQALVEVSVQTSNAGENEPVPRLWRMRITVAKIGDQVKVSNVGFVP